MMRKLITALVAGALVMMAAMGAAFAHPTTYTVAVNGSTAAGFHPFFATADEPIAFRVWNGDVQTDMSCEEVNLEGEVESGVGDGTKVDPVAVVKPISRLNTPEPFDHSEWKECVGLGVVQMEVEPLNDWEIHPTETPVTPGLTDIVDGYVSGPGNAPLAARVTSVTPGICDFEVQGYADGWFDESTQKLTIDETGFSGDLTIVSAPDDCFGLVPAGAVADFEGVFTIGSDEVGNSKEGITQFLDINLISSP